jgi:hypothetical protein
MRAWRNIEIDELQEWARLSRDRVRQAIAFDLAGREHQAVENMCMVLGPSFRNHSES